MSALASTPSPSRGLRIRLIALLLVLVAGTVAAVGGHALGAFESAVKPELSKRARLIGVIVRGELQRALELGVQLDAMAGLEDYLSETMSKFGEVDRIVVRDASGSMIAAAQARKKPGAAPTPAAIDTTTTVDRDSFRLPMLDGNRLVGDIQVDISPSFVRTRLREVFLDVMVIALVATLLAVELILALTASLVTRPLDRVLLVLDAQRAGDFSNRIPVNGLGGLARAAERLNDHAQDLAARMSSLPSAVRTRIQQSLEVRIADHRPPLLRTSDIGDIRVPLFLFSVATEVAVAFLPVYARGLARPQWLSAELAAAAPLVCYLLAVALLTPFGGRLSRRFGARQLFLASVPPVVLSLVALANASHVGEVALWRGVMAVFYATATIACQEYALRAAADHASTRPVGAFVAVVYGGVFCGAALGGVIAGRFGFEAALFTGAATAALSGMLGALMMRGAAGDASGSGSASPTTRRTFSVHGDVRLPAILIGLAVPMTAATAIFVWYLTPLMLTAAGSGPAEVARVVMLYYLCVVVFGPSVTTLSDGRVGPFRLVAAGASASALALLSLSASTGFWAVVGAMAVLGVGHTLMRAPMYTLVGRLDHTGAATSSLRLFERLGAIVGLAACALALPAIGAELSIRALGIVTFVGLMGYLAVEGATRTSDRIKERA